MKAIILAAGFGSRTSRQLPKCLIELPNGKTIFENQVAFLQELGINEIIVVVGFKKDLIMENFPTVIYRYNPIYHITNTAKSLLCALESIKEDDIIWLNGDVVMEKSVLREMIKPAGNLIAVNKNKCGAEEIKYSLNEKGEITRISKENQVGLGEAVGINRISQKDFRIFLNKLRECDYKDYFEKAIELCIKEGVVFRPVDISSFKCVEIDFYKDLKEVISCKRKKINVEAQYQRGDKIAPIIIKEFGESALI